MFNSIQQFVMLPARIPRVPSRCVFLPGSTPMYTAVEPWPICCCQGSKAFVFDKKRQICQNSPLISWSSLNSRDYFVTVQPTRLTTASNIGYILAGAVPVGSAIRASLNKKVIVKMTKFFRHITMPFPLKTCLYGLNGD